MNTQAYRVILFDLGGVLIDLGGVEEFGEMIGETDPEAIWRTWLTSDWVRRYERGACTAAEFAAGMVDSLSLPVSAETFIERFRAWPQGPFPGAVELVENIPGHLVRACLSNTNALHWDDQHGAHGWGDMFDHVFLSHEIGLVKPDPEAYLHVVEQLGVEPGEVLFFDDNRLNVDGALGAGLAAHRAKGTDEVRAVLEELGVLAPDGA